MDKEPIVVTAFYHFVNIGERHTSLKQELEEFCNQQGLKGTILLAPEGINSTISGTKESILALHKYLRSFEYFTNLVTKESYADTYPFHKMKVRLKKEIVAMGAPELDINSSKGTYIKAQDWDNYLNKEDVIVVDTRNNYEVVLGTFEGAVNPNTNNFREFPEWAEKNLDILKDKKVLMCCTGGIRCEKSTAYLKTLGLTEVYHLEGGILKYLEETKNSNKKWVGECFVFDERTALDDNLNPTQTLKCSGCGARVTSDDLKRSKGTTANKCSNCI